jgi:uncharacterized RDD family membrane protein YckC
VSCPACGAPRIAGQDRCGGCGALLRPPVEGSLAPNPAARELPGQRRRGQPEKTWKDEVRDRVRNRKQEKSRGAGDQELPLFREDPPDPLPTQPLPAEPAEALPPEAPLEPGLPPAQIMTLGESPEGPADADPYSRTERMPVVPDDDLPLNLASRGDLPEPAPTLLERVPPPVVAESMREEGRDEWSRDDDETAAREESPVERPAFPGERARAAVVDLLLLSVLWSVVVYFAYFAGRAPRPATTQLVHTWPWLLGYLTFLGLTYAAYFTGTTGQTPGKILGGLRVVDTAGRPPGYTRAFLRAGLGALGVLLAGLGLLPVLMDPARRALHDKLLGTRVVRH